MFRYISQAVDSKIIHHNAFDQRLILPIFKNPNA